MTGPTGDVFNGNLDSNGNRKAGSEGYKTEQKILFETDARRPDAGRIFTTNEVGPTHRTALFGLGPETHDKAGGNSLHIGATRSDNGSVTVDARGNEANPLDRAPIDAVNPGITFNFNVTIQSEGADGRVGVTVTGQHDGFPAYEIIVERPESGNTATTVYSHDPRPTGQTPLSLAGSGEFQASQEAVIQSDPRRRRQ